MTASRLLLVTTAAAVLAGCAASGRAPVEDRRPPAARAKSAAPAVAAAPQPAVPEGFHLVKRGETLYSIALENGLDYRELAQWNSMDDPSRLLAGQVLRVTPPAQTAVQVGTPHAGGRVESRALDPVPVAKAEPAPTAKPAPKPDAPVVASSEPGQFIWPAKGKVLAGFAEPRHKGIDIEGKIGDPVTAAAAGRVTYVGTGIAGLGKLVVIKHDNGFITVYAHNKDILVKEQQNVTRGQRIADLGNTDADRPKLHFQIRKGAAAVDPMRYLPAS